MLALVVVTGRPAYAATTTTSTTRPAHLVTTTTTSTTTTISPFREACRKAGIELPTQLPDQDKCTKATAPDDEVKKACKGWAFKGVFTVSAHADQSGVVFPFQRTGGARLYQWGPKGHTVCWYLWRGLNRGTNVGNGTLNDNRWKLTSEVGRSV